LVRKFVGSAGGLTCAWSGTPLQALHGIITPNGLHFERHHGGVPSVNPDYHRLIVHGLVERPLVFTMADLLRFPSVSRIHFLECAGNTPYWHKGDIRPDWTAQDTHGLLSCCEWTGVLLADVLAEAGPNAGASWVLAEGADAAAMARSVPMANALSARLRR
jgi:sulfane dehydrogenase subunit SoxC